jgi:hypothetical protein
MEKIMSKANGKVKDSVRFDQRIVEFLACRSAIESLEEKHKAELKPFQDLKTRLQGQLLKMLQEAGAENVKTERGTVYIDTRAYAACTDPDVFMNYVTANGAFELLDRRPNGTACKDFCAETGSLPPGVRLNTKITANVRTS